MNAINLYAIERRATDHIVNAGSLVALAWWLARHPSHLALLMVGRRDR